jgi:hypothetical protein
MLVSKMYWQMLAPVCLLGSNLNVQAKPEKLKTQVALQSVPYRLQSCGICWCILSKMCTNNSIKPAASIFRLIRRQLVAPKCWYMSDRLHTSHQNVGTCLTDYIHHIKTDHYLYTMIWIQQAQDNLQG